MHVWSSYTAGNVSLRFKRSDERREVDFHYNFITGLGTAIVSVVPVYIRLKTHCSPFSYPFHAPCYSNSYFSHEIINLVKGSDVYIYQARVSSRPPSHWRRAVRTQRDSSRGHSRVWLIGDAMHAMLPTRYAAPLYNKTELH